MGEESRRDDDDGPAGARSFGRRCECRMGE
jgi:hypothetical protein